MPVDPVRDAAIDVLLRVFERDAFIAQALNRTFKRKQGLSPRGKRFLTQLVYGTTRHRLLCEHVLAPLLHQPFAKLPAPMQMVLRMGVFQSLFCNQVTFPAMVHTSVDLAKKRGHAGTARLANAVLKRVPQSLEDLDLPNPETEPAAFLSTRYSIAPWLVDRWLAEFGIEQTRVFCEAADEEAPRTVRLNPDRTTPERFEQDLAKAKIPAKPHEVIPNAYDLAEAIPLRSQLFRDGHFYVQDAASMLPTYLVQPEPGERVLDLCAAPGGKCTHLAELGGKKVSVVANELSGGRMYQLLDNIERLGHANIHPVVANGEQPPYREGTFDRVLLDAPCSGLGTLRRHPELKWRVQPQDPARMAEEQRRLLRSAVALCKIGGVVVYSVCTFTPEETREVVDPVPGELPVVPEDGPAWLNPWKIDRGTYRILPSTGQLDGYFLTRFRKQS